MRLLQSVWIALTALALCAPFGAHAADLGNITAAAACPAYQSIAKMTNPGGVMLTAGRTYTVTAHNKEPPTFLQVVIDTAVPKSRWVDVGCVNGGVASTPTASTKPSPPSHSDGASHLLALAWEPSFCLSKSDKAECQAETAQSPDARQLSLHGLWPQPNGYFFCIDDPKLKAQAKQNDQAADWGNMPDPHLSQSVYQRLAIVMPGVRSKLEFHEWNKHGTCFGGTADAYFSRAIDLVDQINHSDVGSFIAANLGKTVTASDIVAAFVKAFGQGATSAVSVSCTGQNINEIDVYLSGDVAGSTPLSSLLHKADKAGTCKAGMLPVPKSQTG